MSERRIDLTAIRARLAEETGPRLWRSIEELADTDEIRRHLATEFPDVVQAGAIDRRTLLRLTAASLALAGLAACERAQVITDGPLVSHARGTTGYVPGVPLVFATSLELGGYGRGLLVKSQDGRPIKIDGNPLHPAMLGGSDPFAQAEVLSLYDPDRGGMPTEYGVESSFAAMRRAFESMRADLEATRGRGLHILMQPVASPTVDRLVQAARARLPEARWYAYSPITDQNRRDGAAAAFGRPLEPIYDLTEADAVVTLGGDLFAFEPGQIRYAADYQARRRADRPLPRLVAVETTPSLVGARADLRLSLKPSDIEVFARELAAGFGIGQSPRGDSRSAEITELLRRAGSAGLVAPGREQPPVVHALAHAINERLGAFGTTVRLIEPLSWNKAGESGSIGDLAEAIAGGSVSHCLVIGGNPAYDAPADLEMETLIRRVPQSLHLGFHPNETAAACRWYVPQLHGLESWGDLRAFDGTVGLRQPATAPLRSGFSPEEMLGLLAGFPADGQALVRATWQERWSDLSPDALEARWIQVLEDGVVPDTAAPAVRAQVTFDPPPPVPVEDGIEAVFSPDPSMWDGRYANNGWLQELPKPLTKQVWGNAALIAPETAIELGLTTGRLIDVTVGANTLRVPIWILPGHAPGALTLSLGYGRTDAGSLGNGVGFNAYRLRNWERLWTAPAAVEVAEGDLDIITTQHHHTMGGRDIVRVVAPGEITTPGPRQRPSLYPEWVYDGYAWGMAIDLDACIGCNACVVSCQAENNVPVVGPEQVDAGREMHWLRVDRYYAGDPAGPETYFQPLLCMHCEKAPCEVVCPVNATVHSEDGLNDMVYNRCIGTRTCSNNCPYKVRRFNFLDYRTGEYAAPDDALNPQVTLRDRGVMEKCTFCVQRIAAARIEARLENRRVRDGEVATACQEACPTRAIVFGDQNDPNAAVSRLKSSGRNYALLGELNTQPRATYLARISPSLSDPAENG